MSTKAKADPFAEKLFRVLSSPIYQDKSDGGPYSSSSEHSTAVGGLKLNAWWSSHFSGIEERFLEVKRGRTILYRVFARTRFMVVTDGQNTGIEEYRIVVNRPGTWRKKIEAALAESTKEKALMKRLMKKAWGRKVRTT